jgi:hypothetical protein
VRHVIPAALAAALALTGCSGQEPTYPSRGRVVYKGSGEPVSNVTIWFESTRPPYQRASGIVEDDGTFSLSTIAENSGAIRGEHRVRFDPGHPGGVPIAESAEKGLATIMDPKYLEFRTSGIVVTVDPRPGNEFTIEVERGPHARRAGK